MKVATRHIALNFGNEQHFNHGIPEFSRQLATQIALRAAELRALKGWHFHYYLLPQLHGMFGDAVQYHAVSARHRYPHRGPVVFDLWHGLHQHLRYRPPVDARCNLITLHDLNYAHTKIGLRLWRHRRRHRQCLYRAHHIIAVSDHARADLLHEFLSAPHSQVIHNGVADLSAAPVMAVPELEGTNFFLHISRMAGNKNVESLLRLAAEWPQQQFVLAGPANDYVRRHREFCRERKLDNVLFLTDISERTKAWLYRRCQVFLFPSTIEGFGMPPIEAMYFGKPVVVARRSSLPEVCGTAARYFDDFDPSSMRAVIAELLQRVQSGSWSAAAVRAHAMRYHWSKAAQRYLDLYARSIGEAADHPGHFAHATPHLRGLL